MLTFPARATVLQWNCRSFRPRVQDLRSLTRCNPIPILCFSEVKTKLPPRLSPYVVYTEVPQPKAKIQVATLVLSSLTSRQVPVQVKSPSFEAVVVQVEFRNMQIHVVNLYIWGSLPLDIVALRALLSKIPKPFVLTGDLNAHHPLWGSYDTNSAGTKLVEILEDLELTVINDGRATYISPPIASHLDVTAVSLDLLPKCDWEVGSELMGSDHLPTFTTIQGSRSPGSIHLPITNWLEYRSITSKSLKGVTSAVDFQKALMSAKKEATEKVKCQANKPAPDMELCRLQKERHTLEQQARNSQNNTMDQQIQIRRKQAVIREHIKDLGRRRWEEFANSISKETSFKKLFDVTKSLQAPRSQNQPFNAAILASGLSPTEALESFLDKLVKFPDPLFPESGEEIQAAAAFVTKYIDQLPIDPQIPDDPIEAPFSPLELEKALESCDHKKSSGPDEISYKDLRSLDPEGRKAFLEVINNSWKSGKFPDEWKSGYVIPVPKIGKPAEDINGYRKITLSSCAGKVFERMIKTRMEWFIEHNKILDDSFTAYRSGRGTWDNITELISDLEEQKTRRRKTAVVFLDLERAFDSVPHCDQEGLDLFRISTTSLQGHQQLSR
jgi:hypothetical protein